MLATIETESSVRECICSLMSLAFPTTLCRYGTTRFLRDLLVVKYGSTAVIHCRYRTARQSRLRCRIGGGGSDGLVDESSMVDVLSKVAWVVSCRTVIDGHLGRGAVIHYRRDAVEEQNGTVKKDERIDGDAPIPGPTSVNADLDEASTLAGEPLESSIENLDTLPPKATADPQARIVAHSTPEILDHQLVEPTTSVLENAQQDVCTSDDEDEVTVVADDDQPSVQNNPRKVSTTEVNLSSNPADVPATAGTCIGDGASLDDVLFHPAEVIPAIPLDDATYFSKISAQRFQGEERVLERLAYRTVWKSLSDAVEEEELENAVRELIARGSGI
ncbi:hypothetical protein BC832DRAFT_557594 [Gaertneriomyces semiglobifer]|nr:hypothetical protein BC832DRAFT_557594 [Gaertneriomyces semiglobifer]